MTEATRTRRSRALLARAAAMPGRSVLGNIVARVVALVSVALVTVLVARAGGAEDVGLLALMRVLPGLVGVLAACGLPSAIGYFVAGPDRDHPSLWPTLNLIMGLGAVLGTLVWFALTPIIHDRLMDGTTTLVVAAVGATVATQLPVAVSKATLQALGDSRGASVVIAAEEAAFVPAYGLGWALGLRSGWLLDVALLVADVVVALGAGVRIAHYRRASTDGQAPEPDPTRRVGVTSRADTGTSRPLDGGEPAGHRHRRPDRDLAGRVLRFGLRSQVGGLVNLLNLRLDVVVLGAFAGAAPVGVYVVASKYAELLRLPALALTWVAYPSVARHGAKHLTQRAGITLPRLLLFGAVAAVAVGCSAFPLLPMVYGREFAAAAWPAALIAVGLVAEPAAGLASAHLMGTGRPGVNSAILGVGLVITVALDLLLIPRHGALGAALASAIAYLVTDVVLIVAMRRGPRQRARP
jgi:O-antigen/teichoic acid export membrane protein